MAAPSMHGPSPRATRAGGEAPRFALRLGQTFAALVQAEARSADVRGDWRVDRPAGLTTVTSVRWCWATSTSTARSCTSGRVGTVSTRPNCGASPRCWPSSGQRLPRSLPCLHR
jgi:hypothetical protein